MMPTEPIITFRIETRKVPLYPLETAFAVVIYNNKKTGLRYDGHSTPKIDKVREILSKLDLTGFKAVTDLDRADLEMQVDTYNKSPEYPGISMKLEELDDGSIKISGPHPSDFTIYRPLNQSEIDSLSDIVKIEKL